MTVSVCPRVYLQNYMFDLHQIFYASYTYVRGSVLLVWRCDTLCTTSGFVDDVMFVAV